MTVTAYKANIILALLANLLAPDIYFHSSVNSFRFNKVSREVYL